MTAAWCSHLGWHDGACPDCGEPKNLVLVDGKVKWTDGLLRVTNSEGRAFNVRVVREGDRFGLDDCLTHDKTDPMIEFYDATYEGQRQWSRGQFVSRYYASTLAGHGDAGLDLDGGVAVWHVSADNVRNAIDYERATR